MSAAACVGSDAVIAQGWATLAWLISPRVVSTLAFAALLAAVAWAVWRATMRGGAA